MKRSGIEKLLLLMSASIDMHTAIRYGWVKCLAQSYDAIAWRNQFPTNDILLFAVAKLQPAIVKWLVRVAKVDTTLCNNYPFRRWWVTTEEKRAAIPTIAMLLELGATASQCASIWFTSAEPCIGDTTLARLCFSWGLPWSRTYPQWARPHYEECVQLRRRTVVLMHCIMTQGFASKDAARLVGRNLWDQSKRAHRDAILQGRFVLDHYFNYSATWDTGTVDVHCKYDGPSYTGPLAFVVVQDGSIQCDGYLHVDQTGGETVERKRLFQLHLTHMRELCIEYIRKMHPSALVARKRVKH